MASCPWASPFKCNDLVATTLGHATLNPSHAPILTAWSTCLLPIPLQDP